MASNYYPGQRIRVRGEEWQVTDASATQIANGGRVWEIKATGLSGIVNGQGFVFLDDLDEIEVLDPTDIEPVLANVKKAKLYWEACLRRLLPRNGAIYLGQHGACTPYEYQIHPAAKALNMNRSRILIGDSVGLGKTIECGILLSELIRRGKARRVLCAVPKAVLEQFQNEMWARFSIPFHRLDSKGLERLRQDLPSTMNPFYHFEKAIISIDTLKLKKYQRLLEDCHWDALIIDECHNVADRTDGAGGSARHRVAKRLAEKANSVILMSATPHDGTRHGFSSLVKLLDRTKIKDDENYSFEDFKDHFIRRTRSDVADQISQKGLRKQQLIKTEMRKEEVEILSSLHYESDQIAILNERGRTGAKELFKTTLIKSFLSSPAALCETASRKLKNLEKRYESNEIVDEKLDNGITFLRNLIAEIEDLPTFSRLERLKEFIDSSQLSNTNRLVIFTERIKTMESIKDYLLGSGIADGLFDPKITGKQDGKELIACAQGSMSDVELNRIVKAFQANTNGVKILVATNVASEGLNLHKNCHKLVHFDLPWSLITLEQRNGRIDRLGQMKTPEIYYFASQVTEDSRETKASELKDDFWIIEKIQKRIAVASSDMDEDALSRFSDASHEEERYTEQYESPSENPAEFSQDDLAAFLFGGNEEELKSVKEFYRKPLPTLFEKSPADFIVGICKEKNLTAEAKSKTAVAIKIDKSFEFEAKNWPREYRPDANSKSMVLESSVDSMQKIYEKALNDNTVMAESFMNEIHPAISLLENSALGLFDGKAVPTLALKGDNENDVYFLVQSTLFNKKNDVVVQYWQILHHKKGSSKINPIFDMNDKSHAIEVCNWLNTAIKNSKKKPGLDSNEEKRLCSLTNRIITEMDNLTKEARNARSTRLRPVIKAELARIKSWESEREKYLEKIVNAESKAKHKGIFSITSKAKKELESIRKDSQKYNDFVKDYMSTNTEADIRILGCFIEGK